MMRKSFAKEKEIWWELDKKCCKLASLGKIKEADEVEGAMKHFQKPSRPEYKLFYDNGY